MYRGELCRKTGWASALLLILLTVRGVGGADDSEPGPDKPDPSSADRQRRFTSAPDARGAKNLERRLSLEAIWS